MPNTDLPFSDPSRGVVRRVQSVRPGRATEDGAGVRLVRLIDASLEERLDPFLMLDFFGSDDPDDYIAGFPTHPHRGFETITYMIAGRMRHRDSAGHEGLLEAGGMQWMTAGRGVLHSEMPEQTEGRMAGFQLWLNLPARDKMRPAWYRDIPASELPRFRDEAGTEVVVLAGRSGGVRGLVDRPTTDPLILDIRLGPGATFVQDVPGGYQAFAVPYAGGVRVDATAVPAGRLVVLENRDEAAAVVLSAGEEGGRVFLVAGRPLREPVARHGPFVMNTEEEIREAVRAYHSGELGVG
jgi:redox-sensitive bicupin YhaK (pirin superfamily)